MSGECREQTLVEIFKSITFLKDDRTHTLPGMGCVMEFRITTDKEGVIRLYVLKKTIQGDSVVRFSDVGEGNGIIFTDPDEAMAYLLVELKHNGVDVSGIERLLTMPRPIEAKKNV